MSDMEGTKAIALWEWAGVEGRAMLRLDYSGCGASEGPFEDGTLDRWRDDVLKLIDTLVEGPRSEEHTSELQSLMRISYAVFCLKKKKKNTEYLTHNNIVDHQKKINT